MQYYQNKAKSKFAQFEKVPHAGVSLHVRNAVGIPKGVIEIESSKKLSAKSVANVPAKPIKGPRSKNADEKIKQTS